MGSKDLISEVVETLCPKSARTRLNWWLASPRILNFLYYKLELLIRSNSSVITFLKIVTDFQFFRNKDKVARSIKIIAPDSKLFTVTPAKKSAVTSSKTKTGAEDIDHLSSKVAPGMEITYIVKFFPEAKSDYAYDLMIITEREKFIIPIRA